MGSTEIVAMVRKLATERFVVERACHRGRRAPHRSPLNCDALQMGLNTAESRIRRLSKERPARLVLFDLKLLGIGQEPFKCDRARGPAVIIRAGLADAKLSLNATGQMLGLCRLNWTYRRA